MKAVEKRDLDAADERHSFLKGKMELVTPGGVTFGRATFDSPFNYCDDREV